MRGPLPSKDADLAGQIDQRFAGARAALDAHRGTDPTGNGYAIYTTLSQTDTRSLSTGIDALAEPLSRVAAALLT